MNFLERTFGKLHSPHHRRRRQQQARHLDPIVRQSLCHVVSQETAEGADALREVQAELLLSNEQLQVIQEREQFLGIRTRQYRKALDEQMVLLQAEKDRLAVARKNKEKGVIEEEEEEKLEETLDEEAMDPEQQQQQQQRPPRTRILSTEELKQAEAVLHRRMEKWQADEQALSSIVETHKVILSSCENMRRSIFVLQEKEKKILKLRGDCEDFLDTAAALGQEEHDGSVRIAEQRMNEEVQSAQEDENERNGSQHNEGTLDAGEVESPSEEDGHLEDVAV